MQSAKRAPGKGRGRGLLALTSYEPLPRPSKALVDSHLGPKNNNKQVNGKGNGTDSKPVNVVKPLPASMNNSKSDSSKVKVMAKYNFQANIDQPGGFKELSIKQAEHLTLICKGHIESKNPLWWEVKNGQGESGYVPANYCQCLKHHGAPSCPSTRILGVIHGDINNYMNDMTLDTKPTALPWIENRNLEQDKLQKEEEKKEKKAKVEETFGKPVTPVLRAYKSAYTENTVKQSGAAAAKDYYCDICDKQLNGPTPYSMHMTSKAHREEMEYLKSQGQA